jgi:hypothetical protein
MVHAQEIQKIIRFSVNSHCNYIHEQDKWNRSSKSHIHYETEVAYCQTHRGL